MADPAVVIIDAENEAASGDLTVMAPGTVWVRTGDMLFAQLAQASYDWALSSSGEDEFYLTAQGGGDPSITATGGRLYISGRRIEAGTAGSLSAIAAPNSTQAQHAFADNDSLGYTTIYLKYGKSLSYGNTDWTLLPGTSGSEYTYDTAVSETGRNLWVNGTKYTKGTAGSLTSSQWDQDGTTIHLHLADSTDPDSLAGTSTITLTHDPDELANKLVYYSYTNPSWSWGDGDSESGIVSWSFPEATTTSVRGHSASGFYDEQLTYLTGSWTAAGSAWNYDSAVTEGTNAQIYENGGTDYSGDPLTEGTFGSLAVGEWAFSGTTLQIRLSDDSNPNSAASNSIAYAEQYTDTITLTFTEDDGGSDTDARTVLVNPCTRTKYWLDSDSGNDTTGTGTKAAPWATLQAAGAQATRATNNIVWMCKNGTSAVYAHTSFRGENQVIRGYGSGTKALIKPTTNRNTVLLLDGSTETVFHGVNMGGSQLGTIAISTDFTTTESETKGYVTVYDTDFTTAVADDMSSAIGVASIHKGLHVEGCEVFSDDTEGIAAYFVVHIGGFNDPVHPAKYITIIGNDNGYGNRDEAVTRMAGSYIALNGNTFRQTDSDSSNSPTPGGERWKAGIRWMGGSHFWAFDNELINCAMGLSPASNLLPSSDFVFERNTLTNDGDGANPDNAQIGMGVGGTVTGGMFRNNKIDSQLAAGDITFISVDCDDFDVGSVTGTKFLGNTFVADTNAVQAYTIRVFQWSAGDVSDLVLSHNVTINPASTATNSATTSDAWIRTNKTDDTGADMFAVVFANWLPTMADRAGTIMDPDHVGIFETVSSGNEYKSISEINTATGGSNNTEADVEVDANLDITSSLTAYTRPVGLREDFYGALRDANTHAGASLASGDSTAPSLSNAAIGNSGGNLTFTFDSDEQAGGDTADITVTVDGPTSGSDVYTFDADDFTESGSGPWTYTLNATQAYDDGDGEYTITVDVFEDAAGNDGGGALSDSYTYSSAPDIFDTAQVDAYTRLIAVTFSEAVGIDGDIVDGGMVTVESYNGSTWDPLSLALGSFGATEFGFRFRVGSTAAPSSVWRISIDNSGGEITRASDDAAVADVTEEPITVNTTAPIVSGTRNRDNRSRMR